MKKIALFFSLTVVYSSYAQNTNSLDVRIFYAYAEIPRSSALNLGRGDFTMEAWIKAATFQPADYPQILSGRQSKSDGFFFGLYHFGNLTMQIDSINISPSTSGDLRDNVWHHVAVTRDSGLITYYVDGQSRGTATSFGDINSIHPIWVGLDQPTASETDFQGFIDEVRIWNFALGQNDIQLNMRECLTGQETGLVGYWTFNNLSGSITPDLTSNGNSATLWGGASINTDIPFICPTQLVVNGNVYGDINSDCIQDSFDIAHPGVLVRANPGPSFGYVDATGNYTIYFQDPGNYTISIATQDTLWQQTCTTSHNVQ